MKHRSAVTGKAVSDKEAKANPSTTVKEGKAKDTLRLDWLQKTGSYLLSAYTDGHNREAGWECISINDAYFSKTARGAIDKAMQAEKK